MTILLTGAAGYVGQLLVESFLKDPRITKVIALDRKNPSYITSDSRVVWIKGDLKDADWEKQALRELPIDVVIHAAFQIRIGYGGQGLLDKLSNVEGSGNITRFSFRNRVRTFIFFSSVSVYGALPGNTLTKRFSEDDPLRETSYPYGGHKRMVEENLLSFFESSKKENPECSTRVVVIRPAAITGPRGQEKKRFGLIQMLTRKLPFIPVSRNDSGRQFVHEEDVVRVISFFLWSPPSHRYECFNLASDDYLTFREMARILKKVCVPIPHIFVKTAFALLWHFTRGRIPTHPEAARFYAYPLVVDGNKITERGFSYSYTSREAFEGKTRVSHS